MKNKKTLWVILSFIIVLILVICLIVGINLLTNTRNSNDEKNNKKDKTIVEKDDINQEDFSEDNVENIEDNLNEDDPNSNDRTNEDEVSNKDDVDTEDISKEMTNDELYSKLQTLMKERNYNSYAIKVINSFIGDYQKLFTNEEIYNLFLKVKRVRLNPYNPNYPNLSHTKRAYNSNGSIVINCFDGELDNDSNWDGLRWLLTHEIMHSLGSFPEDKDSEYSYVTYVKGALLEEGLVDSIAHFVKGTNYDTKFAINNQSEFVMYKVNDDYTVSVDSNVSHTYTLYGSFINVFKYVGCYDETIDSITYTSFDNLKACMKKNVNNGEYYYNKLFEYLNLMSFYVKYPNTFYSQDEAISKYPNEIAIKNNNLNNIVINYSKLTADIMNNKIDTTYSVCDYKKNAAIFYSEDGINFKTDLNC